MIMISLFYQCRSLKSLPDISKWKTDSLIDITSIFEGCSPLKYLPDISNWNLESVFNMS